MIFQLIIMPIHYIFIHKQNIHNFSLLQKYQTPDFNAFPDEHIRQLERGW